MTTLPHLAGAVLAGGRSRRMGRDKATLSVSGHLLWRRQLGVLRALGAAPLFLVRAPGQRALPVGRRARLLHDAVPNTGPLGGLHVALDASPAAHLAVLAVDLPALDAAWFTVLRQHCAPGRGAVARTARGYEPLAAIYPRAALPLVARSLAAGEYALQDLLRGLVRARLMRVVRASATDPRLANWNTPADAARGDPGVLVPPITPATCRR